MSLLDSSDLELNQGQNTGLDTIGWSVMQRKNNNNGAVLTIPVDTGSLFLVNFGFGIKVKFFFLGRQKEKPIEKKSPTSEDGS